MMLPPPCFTIEQRWDSAQRNTLHQSQNVQCWSPHTGEPFLTCLLCLQHTFWQTLNRISLSSVYPGYSYPVNSFMHLSCESSLRLFRVPLGLLLVSLTLYLVTEFWWTPSSWRVTVVATPYVQSLGCLYDFTHTHTNPFQPIM